MDNAHYPLILQKEILGITFIILFFKSKGNPLDLKKYFRCSIF